MRIWRRKGLGRDANLGKDRDIVVVVLLSSSGGKKKAEQSVQ